MPVEKKTFDEKNKVTIFTLSHKNGSLIVKIIDYGATITNILFPDKSGHQRDVVLGFDDFQGYTGKNPYFGALVGRTANRTAKGMFSLNGKTYQLAVNNGPNHLHGGLEGFDKKMWTLKSSTDNSITFELISKDQEENYPGTLKSVVTYTVTETNELVIEYGAELIENEQKLQTVVNLTNHSYFNLNGCSTAEGITVLNHIVSMPSVKHYLPKDENDLPVGKIEPTESTSEMDFSVKEHTVGERIASGKFDGYDHCYVAEPDESKWGIKGGLELKQLVTVKSPVTNIKLTFSTTEPGFQLYSGNFLDNSLQTKQTQTCHWPKLPLAKHSGLCLESQRFPNAINNDKWKKQVILSNGEKYWQKTSYKFEIY